MFVVGELRDRKVAQQIERLFLERHLAARVVAQGELYVIVAENEAVLPEVEHIYRLSVGLPIRQEIPAEWENLSRVKLGPLSQLIIISSVALFIYGRFMGELDEQFAPLFINEGTESFFANVLSGEVWRLWTPMLLHFSFLHIFFNLMWVKDIGSALEAQESTKVMVLLTLIYGLLTNVAQYLVVGPMFGGMSGVVFAYLGHMWMRFKFDPSAPYSLPKRDIIFMVGWLVLCMTGIIGAIANVAHAVGLATGMISGMIFGLYHASKNNEVSASKILLYTFVALSFSTLSIVVDWYHNGQRFFFESFF